MLCMVCKIIYNISYISQYRYINMPDTMMTGYLHCAAWMALLAVQHVRGVKW